MTETVLMLIAVEAAAIGLLAISVFILIGRLGRQRRQLHDVAQVAQDTADILWGATRIQQLQWTFERLHEQASRVREETQSWN